MKIFIPDDIKPSNKNNLFLLVRPFYSDKGWTQFGEKFKNWNLNQIECQLVSNATCADVLLVPFFINYYFKNHISYLLKEYNDICIKCDIRGFGFISGDYCEDYPYFEKITYFRMGGFKSKLGRNNKGFPAALSDFNKKINNTTDISIREWNAKPTVGFCGHATPSKTVYFFQTFKFLLENIRRFLLDPSRNDYEIYFQSANYRYKILKSIENSNQLNCNYIFREKYRAGANTDYERKLSTLEYYNNIIDSDYIVCLRGTGNFSIRLYETLMMGRVPIFIDTDCLLPFDKNITWSKHLLVVKWVDRYNIPEILIKFHKELTKEYFIEMQIQNRELWLKKLQPSWILNNLVI